MGAVAFHHVHGVGGARRFHAKLHLAGFAFDHEAPPIDPVGVGAHRPRRLNALPVGIVARPGLVQRFERSVLLLQPGTERRDGALAVAVQNFLGIGPDVARPGRLHVRLIPAVVGKKRFVRRDHPDEFLDVLCPRIAHRLPIEAQSGPATGDIIRTALKAHGPAARIDKA